MCLLHFPSRTTCPPWPAELAAALLPSPAAPALDAAGQAQQFIQAFNARYGPSHPEFLPVSWREAAAAAHRELKFLLVYLHCGQHEDADKFCRSVLCAPALVEEARAQFVCWGGDVRHSDAFQLAGRLQVGGGRRASACAPCVLHPCVPCVVALVCLKPLLCCAPHTHQHAVLPVPTSWLTACPPTPYSSPTRWPPTPL